MKTLILKVKIDLEKQEYGVIEVKSNSNINDLKPNAYEFLALVFEGLAAQYREKLKAN